MKETSWCIGACALVVLSGCGSDSGNTAPPTPAEPPAPAEFHCSRDASCPEVLVANDPFATMSGQPALFRGYGDPSLEFDPDTGTLWMSYTWLDVLISDLGPPAVVDFGVRTHLARSDDRGATFTFVKSINESVIETHPDTGVQGWGQHEVSTLVREAAGAWQILWLKYFDPFGGTIENRLGFHYQRSTADTPLRLGDNAEAWARGSVTSASFGTRHNLSDIAQLSDCAVPTEPGLFAHVTGTYLATNCIVLEGNSRRADLERLVLLRQEQDGYSYVGDLLDADDARAFGADVVQQADITFARDGSIVLLVTPIILGADPSHQGCVVLEFTDFETGTLRRNSSGALAPRAIITADGNGLGPGLCTYDPNSETGVLLVITTVQVNPTDIEFSLRATGVHP